MTKYLLAFAVFVAAATVPHAAQAMSAFAGGIPSSVASRGLAVGDGYNFATRAGAEAKALEECRAQGVAPQDTRDLCSVIAYFDGECLSVALDPAAGTPGWAGPSRRRPTSRRASRWPTASRPPVRAAHRTAR